MSDLLDFAHLNIKLMIAHDFQLYYNEYKFKIQQLFYFVTLISN